MDTNDEYDLDNVEPDEPEEYIKQGEAISVDFSDETNEVFKRELTILNVIDINELPHKGVSLRGPLSVSHTMLSKVEPRQKGSPKELEQYIDDWQAKKFSKIQSAPLMVGAATDAILTNSENKIAVLPDGLYPSGKVLEILKSMLESGYVFNEKDFRDTFASHRIKVGYYVNRSDDSSSITEAREQLAAYFKFLNAAEGKTIVTGEALFIGTKIAQKLKANEVARRLVLGGYHQVKVEWTQELMLPPIEVWPEMNVSNMPQFMASIFGKMEEVGAVVYKVPCKVTIDSLYEDTPLWKIVELKTISDTPSINTTIATFDKDFFKLFYAREVAMQKTALLSDFHKCEDVNKTVVPFPQNFRNIDVRVVVAEGTRHHEVGVYSVDHSVLNFGHHMFMAGLIRYVFHRCYGFEESFEQYIAGGVPVIDNVPRYMLM